jgi:mono/diheme cytochrome c family protein
MIDPKHVILIAFLALLAAGCQGSPAPSREWGPEDHAQPPEAMRSPLGQTPHGDEQAQPPPGTARERALAALFQVHCASCHGAEGRGDGPGRAPVMQVPDFTSAEWQATHPDEELAQVIAQGRGMMPPFGDRIAAENIAGLVERIRAFAPAEPEPAAAEAPSGDAADAEPAPSTAMPSDVSAP